MYQIETNGEQPREHIRFLHPFERAATPIDTLLARFKPISLSETSRVSLLNRTDTKYVMGMSHLMDTLRRVGDEYRVLAIHGTRMHHYQTLYFDTGDFAFYRQHHDGLRVRYKVRIREYVDTRLAYWEVKRKTNRNHTVKSRLQAPGIVTEIDGAVDEFVHTHAPVDPRQLEPKLWNDFLRITLVSNHRLERLTLDVNVAFGWNSARATLPGIAIAEVKQEDFSRRSDFIQQMRRLGIRPSRFSKYCAGVYMLYDGVKVNNFKWRMRLVDSLMQREAGYGHVH